MPQYRVELTELCQKQIVDIKHVLECDLSNPSAARRFIDRTKELVKSLESCPYRFVARPFSRRYGEYEMRQVCFVMNYTAYYIVDEPGKKVIIAEIRYSKQDLSDL